MKKLFTLLAAVLVLTAYHNNVMAQCAIDPSDSSYGFSPPALPCIEQGVLYGQAVQVHVPASLYVASFGIFVPIDSISVTSISGLPSGISYNTNPVSGTVKGGATGCLWFSGTTSASTGNYPLVFHIAAYALGRTIDTTLNSIGLVYTLNVCNAPAPQLCDTLFNLSDNDTIISGLFNSQFGSGYLGGTNGPLGVTDVAEQFSGFTPGSKVGGAFFGFVVDAIAPGDSDKYITVNVWDMDTTNEDLPGNILGSDSFTYRSILPYAYTNLNSLFYFQFHNPVTVTDSLFYIGLHLPDNNSGDSIALAVNTPGRRDGNEYINGVSTDGWFPFAVYQDLAAGYSTDNAHMGMFIGPWLCDYNAPVAQFSAVTFGGLLSSVTGCIIDTVHFADESAGPVSQWSWSFPGGTPSSSTVQFPYVAYATSGQFPVTLTVTDTLGNQSVSTLNNYVNINPSPAVSIAFSTTSDTANTGTAVVTATGSAAPFSFLWSNGATSDSISALAAGTYYVTVTDTNGCATVDTTVITITGINFVSANQTIKVYPNPTTSALNIDWSTQAQAQVEIMDMTGKVMRIYTIDGSLLNKFDISALATGSYVVKITDKLTGEFHSVTVSKQ